MDFLNAIILGIVQGITEFLPISSDGHLLIARDVFGIPDQGLFFDVALHFGTFLAIVIYFWKDIVSLAKGLFVRKSAEQKLVWLIIIGTIPAVVIGLLTESWISGFFRDILWVGTFLIILGLIFVLVEKRAKTKFEKQNMKSLSIKSVLYIGLAQASALLPGISRSGMTIATGMVQKLSRKEAARFSFLLALPATLGAVVFESYKIFSAGEEIVNWGMVILGIIVALIFGFLAISLLLKMLERYTLIGFAWYVLLVGGILLVWRFWI